MKKRYQQTRKSRLKLFGHTQRRMINAPIKKNELIQIERITKRQRKTQNNISKSNKKKTNQLRK